MPATGRTGPPAARAARKVRSSVVYCTERYACARDRAEAAFTCEQCRTDQCENCEQQLHDLAKYAFHDRIRIPAVRPERLCDQPETNGCTPRNFADVICEDCGGRRFCFNCEAKAHRGRLSAHRRLPISESMFTQPSSNSGDADCLEDVAVVPVVDSELRCINENDNSLFLSLQNEPDHYEDTVITCSSNSEQSLLYLSLPSVQESQFMQSKSNCNSHNLTDESTTTVENEFISDNFADAQADQSDLESSEVIPATSYSISSTGLLSNASKTDDALGLASSLQSSVLSPQDDEEVSFLLANQKEQLMVCSTISAHQCYLLDVIIN